MSKGTPISAMSSSGETSCRCVRMKVAMPAKRGVIDASTGWKRGSGGMDGLLMSPDPSFFLRYRLREDRRRGLAWLKRCFYHSYHSRLLGEDYSCRHCKP